MIRTPSGKNLMNEQEAIQWLLDNNALPFQCTADYVGGAEIGLGTIVNPTPAKVRVGSLIFFADSKVSTVIAITSNSFIYSDEYNDLVDDIVYVSNVQLNASGHLIVTLSNGTNIDAGLIKQVSGFSIDASQHLIVSYNDGTTTDLGAIFNGNIVITGSVTADNFLSDEYLKMKEQTGSAEDTLHLVPTDYTADGLTADVPYALIRTSNKKLTIIVCVKYTATQDVSGKAITPFVNQDITVGSDLMSKLYPIETNRNLIDASNAISIIGRPGQSPLVGTYTCPLGVYKPSYTTLRLNVPGSATINLQNGQSISFRWEIELGL